MRTVDQLNSDILQGLHRLPQKIDLVVGVPRSGMLPASLIALHLNCALTDIDAFLEGKIFQKGQSRGGLYDTVDKPDEAGAILVVDDSIFSGAEMERVRGLLADHQLRQKIIFAAVYVSPETADQVDFHFSVCPNPRVFEWNVMHHKILRNACVDIDGVLCRDPTEEENDDGEVYRTFLLNAESFLIPSVPVGFLVTCRLEKYRPETEEWLRKHNVGFGKLIMMDLPNKEARVKAGNHGGFKAKVCRDVGANFFVESNARQAAQIAEGACVDVYCVDTRSLITPSSKKEMVSAATNMPRRMWRLGKMVVSRLKRRGRS